MKILSFRFKRASKGFTLIELLTAMSVFLIIGFMVATSIQSMVLASQKITSNLDNYSQARHTLNLITRDIKVVLEDSPHLNLNILVENNDTLYVSGAQFGLVSSSSGGLAQGDRPLNLVCYGLDNQSAELSERGLRREALGFDFQGANGMTGTDWNALKNDLASSGQGDLVSPGILMVRFEGMDANGKVSNFSDESKAIIISFLVIDQETMKKAATVTTFDSVIDELRLKSAPDGVIYGDYWKSELNTPAFVAKLGPQIRSGLKVFQQFIPLGR